jgi:hypothetical protein
LLIISGRDCILKRQAIDFSMKVQAFGLQRRNLGFQLFKARGPMLCEFFIIAVLPAQENIGYIIL